MKKQLLCTLVAVAALAVMLVAPRAQASVKGDTISINFGANEPSPGGSALDPDAVAGVPGVASANWNNAFLEVGEVDNLVRDTQGTPTTTDASVIWAATNTWCSVGCGGEFNNNFKGDDRLLMAGYVDQNTVPFTIRVVISNLPTDMAASYDVYVYVLGGVPDRGGVYTVNGVQKFGFVGGDGFNGPDYVEDPGDDTSQRGNYLVFRGLSGNRVDISADNSIDFRAPINAVEIVNTSK